MVAGQRRAGPQAEQQGAGHRIRAQQQRRDAQHDDEVAGHLGIPQLEARVDDERISQPFTIDEQRLHDVLQRVEIEMRDRERDLYVQDVAERPEAGVEEDIAHFGQHLAPGRIDQPHRSRLLDDAAGVMCVDTRL